MIDEILMMNGKKVRVDVVSGGPHWGVLRTTKDDNWFQVGRVYVHAPHIVSVREDDGLVL